MKSTPSTISNFGEQVKLSALLTPGKIYYVKVGSTGQWTKFEYKKETIESPDPFTIGKKTAEVGTTTPVKSDSIAIT